MLNHKLQMIMLFKVEKSILDEFKIDMKGKVTSSIRGVARLVDISHQTLSELFSVVAGKSRSKLSQILMEFGFDSVTFSSDGVPESAVGIIVCYYANMAGKRCTAQAKKLSMVFASIGFSSWVKQEKGWQPPSRYAPFILSEPRKWTKMFGDNIYDEFARLTNLTWDKKTHRKPCMFASLTYEFVYILNILKI